MLKEIFIITLMTFLEIISINYFLKFSEINQNNLFFLELFGILIIMIPLYTLFFV